MDAKASCKKQKRTTSNLILEEVPICQKVIPMSNSS